MMHNKPTFALKLITVIILQTFCITQLGFATQIQQNYGRNLRPPESIETKTGALGIGQDLQEALAAGAGLNFNFLGTPSNEIPLASITLANPAAFQNSVMTDGKSLLETVSTADDNQELFITGLTVPSAGIKLLNRVTKIHIPTVKALIADPQNRSVQRWMTVSLDELAAAIENGQNSAVAAAILKGAAFCATRGEAISLQPINGLEETPLDLFRLDKVTFAIPLNSIETISTNTLPVLMLENEENSIVMPAQKRGGRASVTFKRVIAGHVDTAACQLTPQETEEVATYIQERTELEQEYSEIASSDFKNKTRIANWHKKHNELEIRRHALFTKIINRSFPGNTAVFKTTLFENYCGGQELINRILAFSWELKRFAQFATVYNDPDGQSILETFVDRLEQLIAQEEQAMATYSAQITSLRDQEIIRSTIVKLKDLAWNIKNDILNNIGRVRSLAQPARTEIDPAQLSLLDNVQSSLSTLRYFWSLTMLFNGIDYRMETRGRDSLGISIMMTFPNKQAYEDFLAKLDAQEQENYNRRRKISDLGNSCIVMKPGFNNAGYEDPSKPVTITFVYKVATIIGSLGENAAAIRKNIAEDQIFHAAINLGITNLTAIIHSRWASAGIVSISNTHPVDNRGLYAGLSQNNTRVEYGYIPHGDGTIEMIAQLEGVSPKYGRSGHIFVVLNGDIDNYAQQILTRSNFYPNLVADYERQRTDWEARRISPTITTDTKLIPLRIEHYLGLGYELEEAVQRAARDFGGSFAIQVQSDLEPGKIFLAINGEGQGLYIGISPDGFHPASETYGFIDITQRFVRVKPGQVIVLDQNKTPTLENLKVTDFTGKQITLRESDIETTSQTTRDVYLPPQYGHYFSKEVSEAGPMFAATIFGRVGIIENSTEADALGKQAVINLNEQEFPAHIIEGLRAGKYKRIVFTGMGTAHAASEVAVNALKDYLRKSTGRSLEVETMVAPEFAAFGLNQDMNDTIVIIISQSGKTADTNQALKAAIERGATPLGIINARESDASFMISDAQGGVMFTGTGRDIEIAVASTKAYYAQIAAGVIYAMKIAQELGVPNEVFVEDIQELQSLPEKMHAFEQSITTNPNHPLRKAADLFPLLKDQWAIVGSGPAEAAAHEAIIKLSELCYRCFFGTSTTNLKHINFSAVPWVLVLLANIHGENNFVQENITSEVDKMLAHGLAVTIVTTDDDTRFENKTVQFADSEGTKRSYPVDVITVPQTNERFAPIFLTMASHMLAYYIATEMNKRGLALNNALTQIIEERQKREKDGQTPSEILADRDFQFFVRIRLKTLLPFLRAGFFNAAVRSDAMSEVLLLSAILSGDIPFSRASTVLGRELSAEGILDRFQSSTNLFAQNLMRTIDTIAHQAKYVTVGVKSETEINQGNVEQFLATMEHRIEDSHLLLELVRGYQEYLRQKESFVEIIPNPLDPVNGSCILIIAKEHPEIEIHLIEEIIQNHNDAQVKGFIEETFGEGDDQLRILEIDIQMPFLAARGLNIAEDIKSGIAVMTQTYTSAKGTGINTTATAQAIGSETFTTILEQLKNFEPKQAIELANRLNIPINLLREYRILSHTHAQPFRRVQIEMEIRGLIEEVEKPKAVTAENTLVTAGAAGRPVETILNERNDITTALIQANTVLADLRNSETPDETQITLAEQNAEVLKSQMRDLNLEIDSTLNVKAVSGEQLPEELIRQQKAQQNTALLIDSNAGTMLQTYRLLRARGFENIITANTLEEAARRKAELEDAGRTIDLIIDNTNGNIDNIMNRLNIATGKLNSIMQGLAAMDETEALARINEWLDTQA